MPSAGVPTLLPRPSMASGDRCGGRDLDALLAAHPVRHLHRLGADVVEAVLLHLGHGPLDGVLERLRAAQAMAERVAEQREALPREGDSTATSAISRAAGSR